MRSAAAENASQPYEAYYDVRRNNNPTASPDDCKAIARRLRDLLAIDLDLNAQGLTRWLGRRGHELTV